MIIDRSIIAILIAIILLATWVATTFPKDLEFSNPPCYYHNEPGSIKLYGVSQEDRKYFSVLFKSPIDFLILDKRNESDIKRVDLCEQ